MLSSSSKKLQIRHLPGEVSITTKQKLFLIIDTTKNQRYLALAQGSERGRKNSKTIIKDITWTTDRARDDQIATKLQTLMKRRKWQDMRGIIVNAGPGPFTSVRTGVSVANALAYSLKIPIYPMQGDISKYDLKNPKERIAPIYDKPPNITWPKVAKKKCATKIKKCVL